MRARRHRSSRWPLAQSIIASSRGPLSRAGHRRSSRWPPAQNLGTRRQAVDIDLRIRAALQAQLWRDLRWVLGEGAQRSMKQLALLVALS